jgi:exonuclease SbcC
MTRTESEIASADWQVWRDKILAARSDDAALLRLAHQAPGVELKLTAIEALTQEDSFRRAMREFRDQDKRLYRAARSGWQARSGKRKTTEKAEALIANARALLAEERVPVNRAVELDREWSALDSSLVDAPLQAEFSSLSSELGAKARASGEGDRAIASWMASIGDAVQRLKAGVSGVAHAELPPVAAQTLAAQLLELQESAPQSDDPRRMEKADEANRALALAASVVQRAEFLQSLPAPAVVDEAAEKAKIEEWRNIPEVSDVELQTILAHRFASWRNACLEERQREHDERRAQEQEQRAEQKKQRQSIIERDVAAAEAAHASGQVTELTRLIAAIEQALKAGPVNAGLTRRIETLRREQLQLRDWQRWSGRQAREQLVAEAQSLAAAAAEKVAIKAHAEAIEKLRERWKELDKLGGPTNQTLWLALDTALKTAYAPVAAHLEKLKAARDENLSARNRIIEGLLDAATRHFPALQDNSAAQDAKPEWRTVARTLEEARVAWRKLGPVEHTVPRKALQGNDAVTTRYSSALQALETPLQNAYSEAIREREALIVAAQSLVTPEGVVREAVNKVRKLQTEWQTHAKGLSLPRNEESALWTRFKNATDAVFKALDATRSAKEAEFSTRIKAREDIIERLTACTSSANPSEVKRAIAEADTAWRARTELPKPLVEKLEKRYRAARAAAAQRIGELATQASQARFDALLKAIALCDEREQSGDSTDIQARWDAIENLPGPWKARLEKRLQGQTATAAKFDLADVLLNLESALSIESPAEFQADRQRLKLRALKEAMESRRAVSTTPEDIERQVIEAAAAPRPDAPSRERLGKIIEAVRRTQRR